VIYYEAKGREAAIQTENPGSTAVADFLQQLGYREYSRYLSFHFPFTHERSLLEHLRATPWVHCPMRFKAWRQGMTGFPVVDASMRMLWSTGWMHNRARVFTASFLVKNLLLPWQWGLKHFWDTLLDADLECDALGWQYVAGCLTDSKPFIHMMDMDFESRRFDPDGARARAVLAPDDVHMSSRIATSFTRTVVDSCARSELCAI
jgi:deoxyribodipyrimidine photolyase